MKHFHSVFPLIITTYNIHCISASSSCPKVKVAEMENADVVDVSEGDGTNYGSKVGVIFSYKQSEF